VADFGCIFLVCECVFYFFIWGLGVREQNVELNEEKLFLNF
jgi:hypothetical protein